MDILNSSPNETAPVPVENLASSVMESVTAPVASAPEAAVPVVAPAMTPIPVKDLAGSVSGTGTPKASPSTGGLRAGATAPAVTPVPAAPMVLPKTTGQTVGGWNRFAGYNPHAAKNKPKDGRGGPGRK